MNRGSAVLVGACVGSLVSLAWLLWRRRGGGGPDGGSRARPPGELVELEPSREAPERRAA